MATAVAQPQPQAQPPAQGLTEQAVLGALVVLLLSNLPQPQLEAATSALFAPLGIGADAAKLAVALTAVKVLIPPSPGVAAASITRGAPVRRAAFMLNAGRRLEATKDLGAERRHLAQHLAAERARVEAASRVDHASARFGPVLGWYSRLDRATTAGCRTAHGSNFRADTPPMIEGSPHLPGSVHGGSCRCLPGPPWPGGRMLG